MLRSLSVLLCCLSIFTAAVHADANADPLGGLRDRVQVHRLDNGWTFLLLPRAGAPVFSFATYVDVGSAQEVPGITGLAHMFEHMAFKGTTGFGTTDALAEAAVLARMEAAYQAWQRARLSGAADSAERQAEFVALQSEAKSYVVNAAFDEALSRAGAVGMNAFTTADHTAYFYSLPSNQFELFALLESERFLNPVYREFYEERDVVQEERRQRVDSQPFGRLLEQFQAAAFTAHPYHQPVVGYMSDLQSLSITDAEAFFERYYAPANMVTAIVGDLDPAELLPLLEKYFGRIPARPLPEPLRTVEPRQRVERTIVAEDTAQPLYLEGYHVASERDPDRAAWNALDKVFSGGRLSRLHQRLVVQDQLAVAVGSFSSYPGGKYPNLWMVYAVPAPGVALESVQTAVREEIERMRSEPVAAEELARFKTQTRAALLRGLRSNAGFANQLAYYQILHGDWQALLDTVERIDDLQPADLMRVASAALRPDNRTVAYIRTVPAAESR